nr:hypothetical protein [Chlamydiota bacterium]
MFANLQQSGKKLAKALSTYDRHHEEADV